MDVPVGQDASQRRSTSGFVTSATYTSADVAGADIDEQRDYPPPGEFPFTRGFDPEGYRREPWKIEMYAGFGSPEEANRRYLHLLEQGATGGVSIALDLPTQLGLDSDAPLAAGEVGKIGVALDSIDDVEQMFAGVDLAAAGHVFTTANSIAPIAYAWLWCHCERHGIDPESFTLQIQNDSIKEYVARGTQFLPIEAALRLSTDVLVHSQRHTPTWLPISVSGSHMKQAGSSPAQEAAFTIANAITYLEDAQRKGLDVAAFNPTLELHFCTEMDFFEEVAKYRAVRRAWSEIARDRFGVPIEQLKFRLHAATSGRPLTAQQPLNNIARITLQVLAQVLGGVEAARTASWDEALAIPTEGAAVTSVRINQIVANETGIPDSVDPLGGSFYVETLTDRIHGVIMDEVRRIDAMGGAIAAVRNGYIGTAISEGAYQEQLRLERGEAIVVGVNRWTTDESVEYPRFKVDPDSERRQVERVSAVRRDRDQSAVDASLATLREVCRTDDNVMPAVIDAVRARATIGEICAVWRAEFGEYHAERIAV